MLPGILLVLVPEISASRKSLVLFINEESWSSSMSKEVMKGSFFFWLCLAEISFIRFWVCLLRVSSPVGGLIFGFEKFLGIMLLKAFVLSSFSTSSN